MTITNLVSTVHIATADEFVHELSPLGQRFGGAYYPRGWLYRGHADARWPLLPTALRSNVSLQTGEWTTGVEQTNKLQIEAEAKIVLEFLRIADRIGLCLPEDSQSLRRALEACASASLWTSSFSKELAAGNQRWPPDEFLALFALAQHHSVPTRLLDWTTSSYVAAYFAASTAAAWRYKPRNHERHGATHLCLWAITTAVFMARGFLEHIEGPSTMKPVTTPTAGNTNLRAQQGLFLVERPLSIDPEAPVDVSPWDESLGKSMSFMRGNPILYQFCLPLDEAPRLLRLLAFLGTDAAAVFPGFDGVAATLLERKYWEPSEEAHRRGLGSQTGTGQSRRRADPSTGTQNA